MNISILRRTSGAASIACPVGDRGLCPRPVPVAFGQLPRGDHHCVVRCPGLRRTPKTGDGRGDIGQHHGRGDFAGPRNQLRQLIFGVKNRQEVLIEHPNRLRARLSESRARNLRYRSRSGAVAGECRYSACRCDVEGILGEPKLHRGETRPEGARRDQCDRRSCCRNRRTARRTTPDPRGGGRIENPTRAAIGRAQVSRHVRREQAAPDRARDWLDGTNAHSELERRDARCDLRQPFVNLDCPLPQPISLDSSRRPGR